MKRYLNLTILTCFFQFLFVANINAQHAEFISLHQQSKFYVELQDMSQFWNEGFSEIISGNEIDYYSENHALISRASDGSMSIEWKTALL